MKKLVCSVLAVVLLAGCSAPNEEAPKDDVTQEDSTLLSYEVAYHDMMPTIDGNVDAEWDDIEATSDELAFPWDEKEAPATEFKGFVDDENFYFSFVVEDPEVVVEEEWNGEKTVDNEDRVEIFFAPGNVEKPVDYELPTYYAIEVDPNGRVHDYSAIYYRHLDSTFTMEGLETAGEITDTGYSVEGSIPLATLENLGLMNDGMMSAGVFRAEFSKDDEGELIQEWISWVDPKTDIPDFHVNSAFGVFEMGSK